jgi:hypothetical protein
MEKPIEVDVRLYVMWLIDRPPNKLIPEIKQVDGLRAACLLSGLAPSSSKPEALERIAEALIDISLRFGTCKAASISQCRDFLDRIEPLIDRDSYTLAKRSLPTTKSHFRPVPHPHIEYRSIRGDLMAIPKGLMQRAPKDDLSYRIAAAHEALRETDCKKSYVVLGQILEEVWGGAWSAQKIESRIKKNTIPVREVWPEAVWKIRYWLLDPKNSGQPVPLEPPFVLKWFG